MKIAGWSSARRDGVWRGAQIVRVCIVSVLAAQLGCAPLGVAETPGGAQKAKSSDRGGSDKVASDKSNSAKPGNDYVLAAMQAELKRAESLVSEGDALGATWR